MVLNNDLSNKTEPTLNKIEKNDTFYENKSKNRANFTESSNLATSYDPTLGIVLNIDNLDNDTGENKYKRRPLFEWLSRLLK